MDEEAGRRDGRDSAFPYQDFLQEVRFLHSNRYANLCSCCTASRVDFFSFGDFIAFYFGKRINYSVIRTINWKLLVTIAIQIMKRFGLIFMSITAFTSDRSMHGMIHGQHACPSTHR